MNHQRTLVQRVAEELRRELERQERSRRWLANKTGIPQATVARYIRGASAPDMDELDAMCRVLGFSIPDLFERIDRSGGYDPKPVADELLCAIRDLNPEPADSGPIGFMWHSELSPAA